MTALAFLDTNILCYTKDNSDPMKHQRALELVEDLMSTGKLRISTQVVNEFYIFLKRASLSVTEKFAARLTAESLLHFNPVPVDTEIQKRAWIIEERYELSWWDSLIVAAAERSGAKKLYSEDLQHDQQIGDVRIVNPFR